LAKNGKIEKSEGDSGKKVKVEGQSPPGPYGAAAALVYMKFHKSSIGLLDLS